MVCAESYVRKDSIAMKAYYLIAPLGLALLGGCTINPPAVAPRRGLEPGSMAGWHIYQSP